MNASVSMAEKQSGRVEVVIRHDNHAAHAPVATETTLPTVAPITDSGMDIRNAANRYGNELGTRSFRKISPVDA